MDILKIRHPVGTILKDIETKELLRITWYEGVWMHLKDARTGEDRGKDYFTLLDSIYIKDPTTQVLFGHSRDYRNSRKG